MAARRGMKVLNRPGPKVTWKARNITSHTRQVLDQLCSATTASLGVMVQEIIRRTPVNPSSGLPEVADAVLYALSDAANDELGSLTVQTEPEIVTRLAEMAELANTTRGQMLNLLVASTEIDRLSGQPTWWSAALRDLGYAQPDTHREEELPLNVAS